MWFFGKKKRKNIETEIRIGDVLVRKSEDSASWNFEIDGKYYLYLREFQV